MVERHKGNGARALILIVIAAALVLAVASAASAHAQRTTTASAGRWIVFTAQSPALGGEQIFRIKPSGGGLKQLTKGAYPAEAPAFSPDGTRVAFARVGSGIFSMNVDGTGVRQLTRNARDSFPTWSPDGTQVAFIRPLTAAWKVFVMSATGAGARELNQSPPSGRPTWTSKGLLVPTNGDLAKIDPRNGHVLKLYGALIDASVGMDATAVSPNLSSITFVGPRAPDPGDTGCGEGVPCQRFALYSQDLRTRKAPKILVLNGGSASFSPDGKSIAFVAGGQLVIRDVTSGSSKQIKPGKLSPTTGSPPAWQPG